MTKTLSRAVFTAMTLVGLMGLATPAKAQIDYFWNAPNGGTGNWDLATQNWATSVAGPVNYTWLNNGTERANFGNTAGTVTLTTGITAYGVNFSTAGYVITGNTLTLAGTGGVVNTGAFNATINSVIAGTEGLTKIGAGTLTLGGANTTTGIIRINEGVLSISSKTNVNFDNQTAALIIDGGTLRMTMGTTTFVAPRPITIGVNDGTIEVTNAATRIVYAFPILKDGVGEATFIKAGPGQFTLSSGAATPTAVDKLLVTGGYYEAAVENRFTAGVGADAITINGGGINSAGQLNILNRSITVGEAGGRIGIRYTAANETAAIFQIGSSTSTGGLISGTGNLTIENFSTSTGDGWIRFGRANDYTGNTTLVNNSTNAGSFLGVEFTSSGSLNPTGNVTFASDRTTLYLGIGNTATGLAGVSQTFNALNSTGGFGTINAPAGTPTLTVGNGDGSGAFSGAITGPAILTKTGTGTQALSGANTYTGVTNINGGTLLANSTGANSSTSTGTVNINNNGTLGGSGNALGSVNVNTGGRLMAGTGNAVNETLTLGTSAANVTTFDIGSYYRAAVAEGSGASDTSLTGASRAATQSLDLTLAALAAPGGSAAQSVNFELVGTTSLQNGVPYTRNIGTYGTFGPVLTGQNVTSLNLTPGGGVTLTSIGFEIDQATWAINIANNNVIVTFTPVPEPTTILAIGALTFGLARTVRRYRRK